MTTPGTGTPDPTRFTRRDTLRLLGTGLLGVSALPLLSACTGAASTPASTPAGASTSAGATTSAAASGSSSAAVTSGSASSAATQIGGTVSFGSNASDAVPKKAYQQVFDAFNKVSGTTVNVNTVDHNSFQENISNYLQGSPDQAFTWFAGYRMQFFAEQNLVAAIDDVWAQLSADYSDAFAQSSTGADSKKYFIPFYNYPWAVFYRKSVFKDKGYTVPTTWEEFKTLGAKMKTDGLVPLAFGDKDGWPAMGTFDYLNMRINGYQFHMDLMAHKASWSDDKVKKVFQTWKDDLLPLSQDNALGRTWQEAAQSLVKKEAGMYLLGMFVSQQFPAADLDDLDFFAFPEIDKAIGADAVEAPIDGFLVSTNGLNEQSSALMTYLASADAQLIYLKSDPGVVAANKNASTDTYTALQKKAVDLISSAKSISQFLDRDTRPDFASPVVIPAIQQFLKDGDVDKVTNSLESQAKTIFTS
ncbi:carbohydrate ABC transporter substrate-binding protein [Nakamurella sp. A5-74]|uniref:Carbohydrate ABC transporter substrate-binding protein n=1 Tax=Nakamurella sp. A5-74 TaxID=3158264 RepID=A0AAU8DRD6_9ACTN